MGLLAEPPRISGRGSRSSVSPGMARRLGFPFSMKTWPFTTVARILSARWT